MQKVFIVSLSVLLIAIGVAAGLHLTAAQPVIPPAPAEAIASPSPVAQAPMEPEADFYDEGTPIAPASVPKPVATSTVTARSYLVGDVKTGHIYLSSSNASTAFAVASMSKLITAIVATDTLAATTTVRISPEDALQPPDGSALISGESFSVHDLMYPLLLSSSNVAAEALASTTSRFDFLGLMSSVAWEIGMPTAYFADPSGLNPHNRASATDMFALARYLYASRPDILAVTRTPEYPIATTSDFMATTTLVFIPVASSSAMRVSSSSTDATSTATTTTLVLAGHEGHDVKSIHPFIDDPRFLGGKTGRTAAAGETMLTILNIDGHPIAFIVLGSALGRRAADTELLIQRLKI